MHEQFMRLALAQAAQSGSDVPVGAVIVLRWAGDRQRP